MRRREARAAALRALYAIEVGKNELEAALRAAFVEERTDSEGMAFARSLAAGVLEHQDEIDRRIGSLSHDWSLERLAAVDRNTLRLGAYELLYRQDEAPVGVVINEAVELAKSYSTPDSGRFVNGILGALARQLGSGGSAPALPPEGGSQL
ncbi:MAG: transcription antitermination factor NusB [Bacillota bacterium]